MRPNPIVVRRQKMRGLVQGIAAVALAVVAEGILYQHVNSQSVDVPLAAALFAIASALIYRAFGWPLPTETSVREASEVTGWRFPGFSPQEAKAWSFGIVSVAANLAALVLFARGAQLNLAWLLYVASVIGGVVTVYHLDPRDRRSLSFNRPRFEMVALIGILLVAAFFRFYLIGALPRGLWFDEAQQGLASERILADPGFRPIWLSGLSPDPALRMYWQAFLFIILGPTEFALRLIPAAGGMLGVLAIYLLARELFGWRTGLVAGGLLSVMSWHVDFSRIDLSGIWSVAFDALAAYFLVKALRTHRYLDYGLAGVCLGVGVNSYWSSYLFCVVIALYVLHRLAFGRLSFLRASLAGLVVLAVAFVLTVSPLAEFATLHRDQYESRLNQLSLLNEIDQAHSLAPLEHNVVAHVLMFNYQGDANGRHNLSNWPELDQITGGIFILGLIVCLRFWKHPNYFLPVLSLVIIMLGGILSVDFEAPQSIRTIDNSLNSALIAAIPIGFLWSRMVEMHLGRISVPFRLGVPTLSTGAILTIALLAWIARTNYYRYFVLQAHDNASYAAYSIGPTLLAETMNRLGSGYDVYLSPTFIGQPSINFLSPRVKTEIPFDPATTLPLRGHRGAAFFFDTGDAQYFDVVRRFYPSAILRENRLGPTDPVVLYTAIVPSSQVEALKGLDGSFVAGKTADAPTKLRRVDRTIDFNWSKQAPLPVPFVAKWKGVLLAPTYGSYGLRMEAPADAILKIDERDVLKGTSQTSVPLAQGLHAIELTAPFDAPGSLRLWWSVPGQREEIVPGDDLFRSPADNRGLLGSFYPNATWSGQPAIERIDVSVIQHYHFLPLRQPFSVNWTGKIDIPSPGLYRFGTQSIDYSWLYIDGKLVVDNSHGENQYVEGAVNLSAGLHDIRISYLSRSGYSYVSEYWQPPGFPREPLPADRLFPPAGAFPERAGPLRMPSGLPVPTPTPPSMPRVSFTRAPGVLPVSPLAVREVIGSKGSGPGQLSDPRGVAVDKNGNVYVVDTGNQRIDEFTAHGKAVRTIGGPGRGNGQFQEPVAAAINAKGELAVLDSTSDWISRFSTDGTFLGKFGGPSVGFYHPRGMSVGADGNYYVANTGSSQVDVFSPEGALLKKLGGPTTPVGRQPMQPVDVAEAPDGSTFVTDAGNFLLIRFDPTFVEQQSWALTPSDSLRGPHLALANDGGLYVTDPANHRVIHLGPDGKPLNQLGSNGQLSRPVGIATDAEGKVYVVDSDADKVVVYGR